MGKMPDDGKGCAEYVARARNSPSLRDLLFARLVSFGDEDRMEDGDGDENFVPRFGSVVPSKQQLALRAPYPHQEAAWKALDAHSSEAKGTGIFKGVLVMPTGSGKTETAVSWLLRHWIDDGKRVLWLAHREELLRQAARTFYRLAALAAKRSDVLRIRLVSTGHCRFHQIDPADDIVCCSVQSLARAGDDAKQLLEDKNVFVVIDEAHHAPAKSYRDAIHILEGAGAHRLLGLTATPTRTAEKERPELSKLFGGRTLYQVTAAELIARELLARPVPITVKTEVNGEDQMSAEDFKHLVDFHEPSAEMLARLGHSARRNGVIAKHFAANRLKYGKTLVFATDVAGAAELTDSLCATLEGTGVTAEYVASWRPDAKEGQRIDTREVLERFRDPKSGLNILVNVEMLTEGVDLPMTRTVFLARPTSSEVLLRQMIGRALRGPKAGGNKEAHIVSFEDHWTQYRDYLSPMDLFTDGEVETALTPSPPLPPALIDGGPSLPPISWDAVRSISRAIRASMAAADADVFEAVPHGMYVIEQETDDESVRSIIHVYEHQRTCWDALLSHLYARSPSAAVAVTLESLEVEFFGDSSVPLPALVDIAAVVENAKRDGARPEYVPLEGRELCDPRELAKRAHEKDMRASEVKTLLADRHSSLARVIYPTILDFRRAFDDAMQEIEHDEAEPAPKGTVLFEPPPGNPLRPEKHHDLQRLMADALERGSELLGQPLRHGGELKWTDRFIKGWYGQANIEGPQAGRIRINVLLNSPDFSATSLRFLLWHEYLHLHLRALHTPEFRRLERLWPDYAACDRELDALNEKFGVQYW